MGGRWGRGGGGLVAVAVAERGGQTRRRDAIVTVMHALRNATRQIARSGCARYPAGSCAGALSLPFPS